MGPRGMSAMEQLHAAALLSLVAPQALAAAQDMAESLARVEAVLAEVSTERHTSEDHRRCGVCGELTAAPLCCGEEV